MQQLLAGRLVHLNSWVILAYDLCAAGLAVATKHLVDSHAYCAVMQLEELVELDRRLTLLLLEGNRHLLGPHAKVLKSAILMNVIDALARGAQCPHLDWLLDADEDVLRRAVILPMAEETFSILVYPMSHNIMLQAAKVQAEGKTREQRKVLDEIFSAGILQTFNPIRLQLQPGQMLIFDGRLVHAGDISQQLRRPNPDTQE